MGKSIKLKYQYIFMLGAIAFLLSACAVGHCRGRKLAQKKIFIYKPDGSKQCDKKTGISVDTMAEELGEIKVLSKENTTDGMMHFMLCESPTGKINVYEIFESDLEKAKTLGFKELHK
jgi:hypothetical protein